MVKKVLFVAAGAALVVALLFGGTSVSYVATSLTELQESVKSNVPIEFQIKNARDEISKLDPEIHDMMRKIAKEDLEVDKLREEVNSQQSNLDESYTYIMVLRNHLAQADSEGQNSFFVHMGRSYSETQVEKELQRRFETYKTKEGTLENLSQVLNAREAALDAARKQLEETQAKKQELLVRVENLEAQARMVKVAQTASDLNFDNSRVSRTSELLDDIESRIEVEKTLVDVEETTSGRIPLEETEESSDIMEQIDTYFGGGEKNFANKQ